MSEKVSDEELDGFIKFVSMLPGNVKASAKLAFRIATELQTLRAANSDGGVEYRVGASIIINGTGTAGVVTDTRDGECQIWFFNKAMQRHEEYWFSNKNLSVTRNAPPAKALDGIAVKALEWRVPSDHPQDYEDALWVCAGLGGQYSITKEDDHFLLWEAGDNFVWHKHATIAEAKAAAQADFEQDIRSALAVR